MVPLLKFLISVLQFQICNFRSAALCLSCACVLTHPPQTVAATPHVTAFANLPLYFEPRLDLPPNTQHSTPDPCPEFVARTRSGTFLLRPTEAVITLSKTDPAWSGCREHASQEILQRHREVRT